MLDSKSDDYDFHKFHTDETFVKLHNDKATRLTRNQWDDLKHLIDCIAGDLALMYDPDGLGPLPRKEGGPARMHTRHKEVIQSAKAFKKVLEQADQWLFLDTEGLVPELNKFIGAHEISREHSIYDTCALKIMKKPNNSKISFKEHAHRIALLSFWVSQTGFKISRNREGSPVARFMFAMLGSAKELSTVATWIDNFIRRDKEQKIRTLKKIYQGEHISPTPLIRD